jgi:hypothetical protein
MLQLPVIGTLLCDLLGALARISAVESPYLLISNILSRFILINFILRIVVLVLLLLSFFGFGMLIVDCLRVLFM